MMKSRTLSRAIEILVAGNAPRALTGIALPANLRLLVFAPHPDDFDAIGVTLRHFQRNGNRIDVGVVRTGSGVEDGYRPGLALADKAGLREKEQRDSLRFFGLPDAGLTFLTPIMDAEDQPADVPANLDTLGAFVESKAPDIVFLPHGNDTNSGHRVMCSFARQIARRTERPMALLLNRDPKTIAMRTDLYMPFGRDEALWKAELLRFHDSPHQRNLRTRGHGFDERILSVNRQIVRELALRAEYAEAFEVELHSCAAGGLLT
jgi:LmbE family N-acetylglucosaminyl deacetylase